MSAVSIWEMRLKYRARHPSGKRKSPFNPNSVVAMVERQDVTCLPMTIERGASVDEVVATVLHGERIPAKYGRTGFRRNFAFGRVWRGRVYATKQVEAYAMEEAGDWIVITVITKFY